jgi:hypothetical protein
MGAIFRFIGAVFSRLSICSLVGVIAGSFAGFAFAIFEKDHPGLSLSTQQLFAIGLLLGVTGFLLVLYFVGLLLRYGIGPIFWPALVNSLLTALLTVFFAYWLKMPALYAVAGLLIGVVVGALLCRLCRSIDGGRYAKA